MVVVYGIRNCNTVQRATQSLDAAGIAYRFHDFKSAGLDTATAQAWVSTLGLDAVINRRGTTWRKLDEVTRTGLNEGNAAALLAQQPSLVKRPVMVHAAGICIGFAAADEALILQTLRAPA